jgi:hypothetical protein
VPNFKTFVVHRRSYTVSLPPKKKPWPPEGLRQGLACGVFLGEMVQAIAILYLQALPKSPSSPIFSGRKALQDRCSLICFHIS